jgi:hypothetical protein
MAVDTLVGIGVQLAVAAYVYGRLTERTKANSDSIEVLKTSDTKHEGEIGQLFGHLRITR